MSLEILYDETRDQAVLVNFDRPFGPIFVGSRECSLTAQESAEWFLKRCTGDRVRPEYLEQGELDSLIHSHEESLERAAQVSRAQGFKYVEEIILEASIRNKIEPYLAARHTVVATGEPDAGNIFDDAVRDNKWDIEHATQLALATIAEVRADNLRLSEVQSPAVVAVAPSPTPARGYTDDAMREIIGRDPKLFRAFCALRADPTKPEREIFDTIAAVHLKNPMAPDAYRSAIPLEESAMIAAQGRESGARAFALWVAGVKTDQDLRKEISLPQHENPYAGLHVEPTKEMPDPRRATPDELFLQMQTKYRRHGIWQEGQRAEATEGVLYAREVDAVMCREWGRSWSEINRLEGLQDIPEARRAGISANDFATTVYRKATGPAETTEKAPALTAVAGETAAQQAVRRR